ncbi:MAG TPA: hypothetical protein VFB80_24180 [Pirellulaceae bacterium]|nr:hypothetical protein [Pirellulaceae bacterium]
MTHRVFWSPHAERRLEQLLSNTAERPRLAAVAREIDRLLVADPLAFGESRYETVRVGFVLPLGVQFEVLDDVRTVIVYDVWRVDRK